MSEEGEKKSEAVSKVLRLEPYIPEGLIAQFANIFSLSITENEAYLSFYQPEIPSFQQADLEQVQSAKTQCVARIVLTRKGLHALTELLNKQTPALEKLSADVEKI